MTWTDVEVISSWHEHMVWRGGETGPDVIAEGISGWIWTRNYDGARFVTGLTLWDGEVFTLEEPDKTIHFRGKVYTTEADALHALAEHHDARAKRAVKRRDAVLKKLAAKLPDFDGAGIA
jgi:hypothetical protein